jgi:hypothetical protein
MEGEKFRQMPLTAHRFLSGIPIHSLDFIELKGGPKGMKMDEIYRITGLNQNDDIKFGFITKTLFDIRGFIGKLLGWDNVPALIKKYSWITRLTAAEREKSLIPPGKAESISRLLYCYENEILFEIINRTVHCFWVLAAVEKTDGYDLYVAIYVKKLNWRTPIYMTLISPMVKWIVYPAMKKNIEHNWEERFSIPAITPKVEVKA